MWASGGAPEQIILDVDAALVEVHSENTESAASHFKGGYGFHPMFCFADHSGEALAGILRAVTPTRNSGADQLAVVDLAIAQLPAEYRAATAPATRRPTSCIPSRCGPTPPATCPPSWRRW